jgi:hypothetical protein
MKEKDIIEIAADELMPAVTITGNALLTIGERLAPIGKVVLQKQLANARQRKGKK